MSISRWPSRRSEETNHWPRASVRGLPDNIVDLDAKKTYVFKDPKVTFISKVPDVQRSWEFPGRCAS